MRLKFKSILHLAAVLSLWSTSALAAKISLVPWGSEPAYAIVTVEGDLELDDDIRFQAQVGRLKWARVRFNSDGGNPLAGIAIGKIIRLKSFETVVLNGQRCASACAIAWLGGLHRFMEDGARIGFHAAYVQKAGQPTESGVGNALLGSYLAQLGLPESAVIYITQAGPTDITWLTLHEAWQIGIEVRRFTQPPAPLPLAGDIQTRAEQGDARWQEALGLKYLLGDGIPHSPTEGLKWLRRSADQGFVPAIADLGEFYWLGSYGVPQNDVEAVKYLRKAADSGVPSAQYRMGLAYYLGRGMPLNYTNAAGWFFNAARQGHAVAQNNLGVHYFQGLGVQQNIAQAVKWYTCSAEQGYRSAQKNLGMDYRDGIGVQRDYIQAYKWFDLAATNEEGKTVPTSVVANVAIDNGQWYEISDVAIESMQLRDQLATYMTPAQLTAAQQLARKWRPKEKTCVGSN